MVTQLFDKLGDAVRVAARIRGDVTLSDAQRAAMLSVMIRRRR